jgi:hypothetical protein
MLSENTISHWETTLWSGARLRFSRMPKGDVVIELLEPIESSGWRLNALLTGGKFIDRQEADALRRLLGEQ